MVNPKDIIVCTAIADGKDRLLPVEETFGCRFIAFVDNMRQPANGWELRRLHRFSDVPKWAARVDSRVPKILPTYYLSDYTYLMWVDGTRLPQTSPVTLIDRYLDDDDDLAFWRHNRRDCVYDEGDAIKRHGLDNPSLVDAQLDYYKSIGYPANRGLYHATSFLRRNTGQVHSFDLAWWYQYCRYSTRDQLSLPYVLHNLISLKVNIIPGLLADHVPQYGAHV